MNRIYRPRPRPAQWLRNRATSPASRLRCFASGGPGTGARATNLHRPGCIIWCLEYNLISPSFLYVNLTLFVNFVDRQDVQKPLFSKAFGNCWPIWINSWPIFRGLRPILGPLGSTNIPGGGRLAYLRRIAFCHVSLYTNNTLVCRRPLYFLRQKYIRGFKFPGTVPGNLSCPGYIYGVENTKGVCNQIFAVFCSI